jgi:hypothetical protein
MDRPTVYPDLLNVWTAWHRLSIGRSYISTGFGASPGPVSYEAIDAYARRFGPHGLREFEEFLTLVLALDGAYLKHQSEKKPKKKKPKK